MSLEERSSGYQDLVTNNNALLAVMKRKGLWQTYHGPRIRQTLQVGKQIAQWYSRLRSVAQSSDRSVQRRLLRAEDGRRADHPQSMQEILNNEGEGQLMDVYDSYIDAAERRWKTPWSRAVRRRHANGGKQLTGLATAVPIVTNTGIYGGIDRAPAANDLAHRDLRRQRRAVHVDRHAGQLDHDPADAQLRS